MKVKDWLIINQYAKDNHTFNLVVDEKYPLGYRENKLIEEKDIASNMVNDALENQSTFIYMKYLYYSIVSEIRKGKLDITDDRLTYFNIKEILLYFTLDERIEFMKKIQNKIDKVGNKYLKNRIDMDMLFICAKEIEDIKWKYLNVFPKFSNTFYNLITKESFMKAMHNFGENIEFSFYLPEKCCIWLKEYFNILNKENKKLLHNIMFNIVSELNITESNEGIIKFIEICNDINYIEIYKVVDKILNIKSYTEYLISVRLNKFYELKSMSRKTRIFLILSAICSMYNKNINKNISNKNINRLKEYASIPALYNYDMERIITEVLPSIKD